MEPATYLIFSDGDIWISKFLKKGFGHVRVVVNDGYNWIHINPSRTHLEWEIMNYLPSDSPFNDHFHGSTIVKIHTEARKRNWIFRIGVMSCVLMIKYYLGLHSISLTPYQLYKSIIYKELGEIYGRTV